jgi:hypothetical protein
MMIDLLRTVASSYGNPYNPGQSMLAFWAQCAPDALAPFE